VTSLNVEVRERLEILFSQADWAEAERLLVEECSENLPLMSDDNTRLIERIRFAVLKLSEGQMDLLRMSIDDAKLDWRDVLLFAGFAEDVDAHHHWVPQQPEAPH
jgi:ABC-type siderophore export system fused ATPase/permease subunit